MTHLAPHPTHLRNGKPRPGSWRLGLLAGLGVVLASSAVAQVQVGGTRAPSVSVDLSVLDELGPAPNLPRLFGASRPYPSDDAAQAAPYRPAVPKPSTTASNTTVTKKKPAPKRVAQRKPTTPQHVAAVSNASVRLVPPAASSAMSAGSISDSAPATPSNRPGPVAVASPVPTPAVIPNVPSVGAAPPAPAVPPAPAHDEAPAPPAQPAAPAHADNAPTPLAPPPATVTTAAPVAPASAAPLAPAPRVQMASAASAGAIVNTVKFAANATDLPPDSQPVLNSVAAKLLADDTLRVQLLAHATGNADQAMEARRVSLARAVAVRAYLIDKGVRSLRVDVRALGNRTDDGPPGDEVDLLIVSQ